MFCAFLLRGESSMNCGMQNGAAFDTGQSSLICESCFALFSPAHKQISKNQTSNLKLLPMSVKTTKTKNFCFLLFYSLIRIFRSTFCAFLLKGESSMNCGMQNGAAFDTGQSSLICKSCFAMIFTSTQTNQPESNKQLKVASYVSKGNKNKELLSQGHFN